MTSRLETKTPRAGNSGHFYKRRLRCLDGAVRGSSGLRFEPDENGVELAEVDRENGQVMPPGTGMGSASTVTHPRHAWIRSAREARLEIGGYVLEHDREATAAAYSRIAVPGPEECGCWYCRNWVAGREQLVPSAVRELLARLGIPLAGEIEVWEVPDEQYAHLYGGWYTVVGCVVAKPPEAAREFTLDGWQMSWSSGTSYEVSQFAGHDVCELHFLCPVGDFIGPEIADAEPLS